MGGELSGHARLHHDIAFGAASAITGLVAHLLYEPEQRDFHGEVYQAVRACLEKYDQLGRREEQRLSPSVN